MESDIAPGNVVNDDSSKRRGSFKAIPLHANPNLEAFIREQLLLNPDFCVQLDVITMPILPSSAASAAQNSTKPTTQTSRELGNSWKILRNVLKSTKETSTYGPLSRFLTLLMDRKFLFIPWDHSTKDTEGESYQYHHRQRPAQRNRLWMCFLTGSAPLIRRDHWYITLIY
jgi:hypothetical protein